MTPSRVSDERSLLSSLTRLRPSAPTFPASKNAGLFSGRGASPLERVSLLLRPRVSSSGHGVPQGIRKSGSYWQPRRDRHARRGRFCSPIGHFYGGRGGFGFGKGRFLTQTA